VTLAAKVEDGRNVAVKTIPIHSLTERQLEDIKKDCRLFRDEINHPNIVKVLDYFVDDSNFYVVREYIEGGELLDVFAQRTGCEELEARDIVYMILSAVKFCHERDIIHGYEVSIGFHTSDTPLCLRNVLNILICTVTIITYSLSTDE
jgi:serine/threonine protein kinase